MLFECHLISHTAVYNYVSKYNTYIRVRLYKYECVHYIWAMHCRCQQSSSIYALKIFRSCKIFIMKTKNLKWKHKKKKYMYVHKQSHKHKIILYEHISEFDHNVSTRGNFLQWHHTKGFFALAWKYKIAYDHAFVFLYCVCTSTYKYACWRQ